MRMSDKNIDTVAKIIAIAVKYSMLFLLVKMAIGELRPLFELIADKL